jgi:hypothetical protein
MAYLSAISTIDALLHFSLESPKNNDYWNIDDILAEEELIPTKFLIEAKALGFLDTVEENIRKKQQKNSTLFLLLNSIIDMSKINKSIPINSTLDLPIWLSLALAQRDIVEIKNPKYLSLKYYNSLKAGPEVVTMTL